MGKKRLCLYILLLSRKHFFFAYCTIYFIYDRFSVSSLNFGLKMFVYYYFYVYVRKKENQNSCFFFFHLCFNPEILRFCEIFRHVAFFIHLHGYFCLVLRDIMTLQRCYAALFFGNAYGNFSLEWPLTYAALATHKISLQFWQSVQAIFLYSGFTFKEKEKLYGIDCYYHYWELMLCEVTI